MQINERRQLIEIISKNETSENNGQSSNMQNYIPINNLLSQKKTVCVLNISLSVKYSLHLKLIPTKGSVKHCKGR